jgi:hypothetical protein
MNLDSAQILCNHKECDNCSINVYNSTEGKSHFNISIEFKKKLLKLKFQITLLRKEKKDQEPSTWLTNLDLCSVEKECSEAFWRKFWLSSSTSTRTLTSNVLSCLMFTMLRNFTIGAMLEYSPRSLVGHSNTLWQVIIIGKGKTEKSKSLLEVFKFRFEGSLT